MVNRNYEVMLILKPDLGDQSRDEVIEKITKKIEDLEGKITSSKLWAKEKDFFYFLRGIDAEKKKYFKGYYWLIEFSLDGVKLIELKKLMKLEERLLRNLVINMEEKVKVVAAA
ncbi:MAG: 30S ribosomal protein S6 [Candidatus Omnitrophica bacterium]|nr:30S ribosomal protein S6 [Candidatus Omnitrophota bacterium]MCK5492272.1 30S ribosomal protein S6 [Candidatus Omnitrophota bacterium]